MRVTHCIADENVGSIEATQTLYGHAPEKRWHCLFDDPARCVWIVALPAGVLHWWPARVPMGHPQRQSYVEFDVALSEIRPSFGFKSLLWVVALLAFLFILPMNLMLTASGDIVSRMALALHLFRESWTSYALLVALAIVFIAAQFKMVTPEVRLATRRPRFGTFRTAYRPSPRTNGVR